MLSFLLAALLTLTSPSLREALPCAVLDVQSPSATGIAGTYASGTATCAITICISAVKGGYNYSFQTAKRSVCGRLRVTPAEDAFGHYVSFDGLLMAEESDPDLSKGQKPTGTVHGMIEGDEITIQNYGNAMNSYVQLEECGEKYIYLKRQ